MALVKEKKQGIVAEYRQSVSDTGSSRVQIALLTERINVLSGHFKTHKKDFQSRRGLLKLVSRRRKLLDYLKKHDRKEYEEIVKKLDLRK